MGGSSDAASGVECNSRWRAWSSRSGVESSRNPTSKSERLVRAYSARRVFRARQVLLPAIWIGKRAFLCQRRSKALPLLILGFIKIRKGSSWHVGILDFLPLYAAEGFGLAGFKEGGRAAAEFKPVFSLPSLPPFSALDKIFLSPSRANSLHVNHGLSQHSTGQARHTQWKKERR